ncbi:RDD family protein [Pseudoxanthomonas mexicana]|uniref:RDD family protein n=1 Tax=Pseudoxanthomonas mexicana TaxID=128785 RepID=UPI00398A8B2E
MTEWYYVDNQQQRHGPLDSQALRPLFTSGRIDRATLVWREGMDQWEALEKRAGELGLVMPAPPPESAPLPEPAVEPAERPLTGRAVFGASEPSAQFTPPALDPNAAYGMDAPYAPPRASVAAGVRVVAGGEVVLAGFWKRVAASLIDGLIVGIGGGIISMLAMAVLGIGMAVSFSDIAMGTAPVMLQVVNWVVSIGIAAAYYGGFHASRAQATLGKMAIGIKVVRSDGEQISLARGIGRYFATWISYLVLCIGFLMAAFTERKQGLHDFVCDTLVVDKWAYTDHPEWQREELGVVAWIVLILGGLLVIGSFVIIVAMFGMLFASLR